MSTVVRFKNEIQLLNAEVLQRSVIIIIVSIVLLTSRTIYLVARLLAVRAAAAAVTRGSVSLCDDDARSAHSHDDVRPGRLCCRCRHSQRQRLDRRAERHSVGPPQGRRRPVAPAPGGTPARTTHSRSCSGYIAALPLVEDTCRKN